MKDKPYYRIGQIVPSSNTTMETEIPAMFRARETVEPERFAFHSSRMRMKKVTKEELAAMDRDSDRCALELSDARVDVLGRDNQLVGPLQAFIFRLDGLHHVRIPNMKKIC